MGRSPSSDGYERAIELTERAMQVSDETHYEEGEKLLKKAMEAAPEEEIFTENYVQFCLQVAENAAITKEFAEAVIYYRKILAIRENDAEGWMDLGTACAESNDLAGALSAWQSALGLLNPKKGRDKENIQNILENVRMVEKALKSAS